MNIEQPSGVDCCLFAGAAHARPDSSQRRRLESVSDEILDEVLAKFSAIFD